MKKTKKTKTKKANVKGLWIKASKAMQDYYRSIEEPCFGFGESCHGRAELKHHHFFWGQSTALRFVPANLVPLCASCHFAFHKGSHKVKINYEKNMKRVWGEDWEDALLLIEQQHKPMTEAEKRDYLQGIIKQFTLEKDF
jgi:Fe-S cluster biosynthesis and repair protein YggX